MLRKAVDCSVISTYTHTHTHSLCWCYYTIVTLVGATAAWCKYATLLHFYALCVGYAQARQSNPIQSHHFILFVHAFFAFHLISSYVSNISNIGCKKMFPTFLNCVRWLVVSVCIAMTACRTSIHACTRLVLSCYCTCSNLPFRPSVLSRISWQRKMFRLYAFLRSALIVSTAIRVRD